MFYVAQGSILGSVLCDWLVICLFSHIYLHTLLVIELLSVPTLGLACVGSRPRALCIICCGVGIDAHVQHIRSGLLFGGRFDSSSFPLFYQPISSDYSTPFLFQ